MASREGETTATKIQSKAVKSGSSRKGIDMKRTTEVEDGNNEFFDFNGMIKDGHFPGYIGREELSKRDVIKAATALFNMVNARKGATGANVPLSDQILVLILEYTPASGSDGERLFETPTSGPWAAKFDPELVGPQTKHYDSVRTVVRSYVEGIKFEEPDKKITDDPLIKPVLALLDNGQRAGHFLRAFLINYRFTYRGSPVGAAVFAKLPALGTLLLELALEQIVTPTIAAMASSVSLYFKHVLSAFTLANMDHAHKIDALNKGHAMRMAYSGLACINLINNIQKAGCKQIRKLCFSICNPDNEVEMARTIVAFELCLGRPWSILDISTAYPGIDPPTDDLSVAYCKYARCLTDCMFWCTERAGTVTLQQLNGALCALEPNTAAEQERRGGSLLSITSREFLIAKHTTEYLLNSWEEDLSNYISKERKQAIAIQSKIAADAVKALLAKPVIRKSDHTKF